MASAAEMNSAATNFQCVWIAAASVGFFATGVCVVGFAGAEDCAGVACAGLVCACEIGAAKINAMARIVGSAGRFMIASEECGV